MTPDTVSCHDTLPFPVSCRRWTGSLRDRSHLGGSLKHDGLYSAYHRTSHDDRLGPGNRIHARSVVVLRRARAPRRVGIRRGLSPKSDRCVSYGGLGLAPCRTYNGDVLESQGSKVPGDTIPSFSPLDEQRRRCSNASSNEVLTVRWQIELGRTIYSLRPSGERVIAPPGRPMSLIAGTLLRPEP